MRDPECPERLDVLLDLNEITSLPTSSQLSAVSYFRATHVFRTMNEGTMCLELEPVAR